MGAQENKFQAIDGSNHGHINGLYTMHFFHHIRYPSKFTRIFHIEIFKIMTHLVLCIQSSHSSPTTAKKMNESVLVYHQVH